MLIQTNPAFSGITLQSIARLSRTSHPLPHWCHTPVGQTAAKPKSAGCILHLILWTRGCFSWLRLTQPLRSCPALFRVMRTMCRPQGRCFIKQLHKQSAPYWAFPLRKQTIWRLDTAWMLISGDGNWRELFPDGFSATVLVCWCSYIFSLRNKKKRRRRTGGCVTSTQGKVMNEGVVRFAVNSLLLTLGEVRCAERQALWCRVPVPCCTLKKVLV